MNEQLGALKVPLVAAVDTTPGAVLAVQNEEGEDLIVTDLIIDIITESNGPALVDAGIVPVAAQSHDNLVDGLDLSGGPGVFSNISDPGTNGEVQVKWPAGHYVTITATADLTGLVANAYIKWIRVGS